MHLHFTLYRLYIHYTAGAYVLNVLPSVSEDSGPKMYYLEWVSENGSLQLVCVVRCSLCPDPEVGVWTRPVVLKNKIISTQRTFKGVEFCALMDLLIK
jgi:hypothetical protein